MRLPLMQVLGRVNIFNLNPIVKLTTFMTLNYDHQGYKRATSLTRLFNIVGR